jgi:hypothetical protein
VQVGNINLILQAGRRQGSYAEKVSWATYNLTCHDVLSGEKCCFSAVGRLLTYLYEYWYVYHAVLLQALKHSATHKGTVDGVEAPASQTPKPQTLKTSKGGEAGSKIYQETCFAFVIA